MGSKYKMFERRCNTFVLKSTVSLDLKRFFINLNQAIYQFAGNISIQ
jgi:hypothetical protein